MRYDDDELDELFRRLDPATTPEDAPLTVAQLALRDRITGAGKLKAGRAWSRPLWWSIMLPAIATTVIALVVIFSFTSTPRAIALTPPPLQFTGTGESPREVLAAAEHALKEGPAVEAERATSSTGWYLQVDEHEHAKTTAVIAPQVTTIRWAPDQSGEVTIVAGKAYWADESDNPIPPAESPAPGTVISQMTIPAGELGAPTVDPPGTTAAEMSEWLTAMGLPADADAADLIDTINLAMTYWTMTNEQHALLLQQLLEREDVTVVGTGTDRSGRDVVGVTADSTRFPGTRRLLLISTDTGRIVAEENLRTAPHGALPAGSVISYTLWEQ
jgi:hypothetical protein